MNPGRPKRLACLDFPHLALVLIWRAHPELRREAVLLGIPGPGGRQVVLAASAEALAQGVRPGQDWRRAEILCPQGARLETDPGPLAELRQEARLALSGCSPQVEWEDDCVAYLDLGGEDAQGRSEGSRAAQCGRELRRCLGELPRVGVGQSRFTAFAAARSALPGRVRTVPQGRAAEFLSSWPVAELPISVMTVERLLRFGLGSCGDCAAISLVDLQRQFGPEGILLHRLCRGEDSSLVEPWHRPLPLGVRRVLAGGVEDSESLRFGAAELARSLARELAGRGRAAGRIRLTLRGEESPRRQPMACWSELAPALPAASVEELLGPLLSLFGRLVPKEPVSVIEVEALDLVAPPNSQDRLWQSEEASREAVQGVVDRLHERFGKDLVWRVRVRPGHPGDVPEERLSWSSG